METVYEVAHWIEKRFKSKCRAPEAWKILRLVFEKTNRCQVRKKGLRGFRAIALLSVFSKLYTTVLVDLLHEKEEPIEWWSLHVAGRERSLLRAHLADEYIRSTA